MYWIITGLLAIILGLCVLDAEGMFFNKLLLIIMYLMFAYIKTNVDIGAYIGFYDQINNIRDITITDPAFGFIMLIGKKIGLDYYGFLAYLGLIGLIALAIVFRRFSLCPALALSLYFIFDYAAEIVQVRAFLAEIIMYVLMMDIIENNKFHFARFIITLIIGVLFHSTCLYYVLLLLPQIIRRRGKLYFIVGIGCLMVPSTYFLLKVLPIPILRMKLQYYVMTQRSGASMMAILYALLFLLITVCVHYIASHEYDIIISAKMNRLMDIHVVSFVACVLMLYFSSNFYRILRTVMVVDSLALGSYLWTKGKLHLANRAVLSLGVMTLFVTFELWVGMWKEIMESNSLFIWLMS